MVLGMRTPNLLPRVVFMLPSGLMVAKTQIVDMYGSRIVFGGTSHAITHANMLAGVNFTTELGQSFYKQEYIQFKNSVYGNDSIMKNWDQEAKDSPIIVMEDDDEADCTLGELCYQNCEGKKDFRDAIDLSLAFTSGVRTQARTASEFKVCEIQTIADHASRNHAMCSVDCKLSSQEAKHVETDEELILEDKYLPDYRIQQDRLSLIHISEPTRPY